MIPNYPYFGLPNYMRYMNPNFYPQQIPNSNNIKNSYSKNNVRYNPHLQRNEFNKVPSQNSPKNSKFNSIDTKSSKSNYSNLNSKNKYTNSSTTNSQEPYSPIFNLLGLNIYFDDILIVCILFFLYNEHVDDPFLFITLVLLLMS